MQVTRISLNTNISQKEGGRLLAFGAIDLDNEWRIEMIRVVKTWDGRILVCMPSKLNSAGQHKDMVHPLNKDLRQTIDNLILEELKKI